MKKATIISGILLFLVVFVNAQEKKIKFNKGTLKICSSKNFAIKGYNGNEVVIKSLHDKKITYVGLRSTNAQNAYTYAVNGKVQNTESKLNQWKKLGKNDSITVATTVRGNLFFSNRDKKRREGLKKLGKKQENLEYGIYFTIEQEDGMLTFKDNTQGQFIMSSNESYEIMIPNTLKLQWDTSRCGNNNHPFYIDSKSSSLSDFNGEVEISSSLNNMKLNDVVGPVSINTIGGNVTITFDKKTPKKLYSIYSNNGFIDIKLPNTSDLLVDAMGASIYSDLDFNVLKDDEQSGMQNMRLKLKNGKVKMKLNAGLGSIYLRKK
ncbi:MAG: hypothetical protein JXR05_13175 [Flavobacteriaceae bacterium]